MQFKQLWLNIKQLFQKPTQPEIIEKPRNEIELSQIYKVLLKLEARETTVKEKAPDAVLMFLYDILIKSELRNEARDRRTREMKLQRDQHRQRMADAKMLQLLERKKIKIFIPDIKTGLVSPKKFKEIN